MGSDRVSGYVAGKPRIAYDRRGAGPLVVFLHGIGGNRTNWHDQLPAFAQHYTAVAWDARGYGESEDYDGPLEFSAFSADLARLLDHLRVQRAHLVGLSMGGRIAQHFYFANTKRVATLTLADTHAGFAHLSPAQRTAYLQARREPLVAGETPRDIAPGLAARLAGPAAGEGIRRRLIDSIAALRKDSYLKALEATVSQTHIGSLSDIRAPTHLVVGEHDRLTTPELMREMAREIPNACFTVIDGAGHLSNIEKPCAFNAATLAFLADHRDLADTPR
ncbi:MAG: alpha/beta fold hydrolase [Gammaproteobacteria bacterium]|nr:alpha/beta fold hydrolase [Gammaproteobacteria bacterium]NIR83142.1 alpha/beta fold hydrolase [Gammaproteobacteria bacterium]NIR90950.1 alpha/beta fold hydrolase [Gammaproteobacteria bacterium]NIU04307.1 alpha/beta fold hydrolase [Gammaproteobacteria bacterium]NIV52530.1 alpha/beta fold hydrolase [Gammaproteobacteria bacterium]